jgi:hypothetical protein
MPLKGNFKNAVDTIISQIIWLFATSKSIQFCRKVVLQVLVMNPNLSAEFSAKLNLVQLGHNKNQVSY